MNANFLHKLVPMNPAPPVTKISCNYFIKLGLKCIIK